MHKIFEEYIKSISDKYRHEETSEMGYRADFEILLKGIFRSINVHRIDHDAKAKQGNKPDFIILNHGVPILYIEAKDIGISLDKTEKSEQMARYFGYANLVLTDYVEFRFYRNGVRYEEPIKIAGYKESSRTITSFPDNYENLAKTLVEFTQTHKEPIKSGEHLAKIMGGKAQRIRDNVKHFLANKTDKNEDIKKVYDVFKKRLVHDLTPDEFADMYAQTLVYGLFVARYHDNTPNTFSRREARDLLPKSNPLLRHFFDHIVGADFDDRLDYITAELCDVFLHADVVELMKVYYQKDLWGETHGGPDPVIHFYEDFLKEYDPELRKKMGAFYTPLPVVRFIVRSVDKIIEKEFGLSQGLADTSKVGDIHRVQILDPAAGTGTFLSEVLYSIYSRFSGQEGRWPTYVHHDLLPRLHGFELMMAPYVIAHLKLGMVLKETKFKYFNSRLGIYLTNSLEEGDAPIDIFPGFGFADSIAEESKEAAVIKNRTPIMVIIGNPPYSKVSSNETPYANKLVAKYKMEPGRKQKLQERKHWLNDDYVKFIALTEDLIQKNGEGVIGFITNHGYLDNPTFRGMRWHLMETFDSIWVIDLHGNAKKKEVSPDGSKDENVFAIQQGVAIMLAIKTGKKNKGETAKIYRHDLWGKSLSKYEQLNNFDIYNNDWTVVEPRLPNLLFTKSGSIKLENKYNDGFRVDELFINYTTGVVTMGDEFVVDTNREMLQSRLKEFLKENLSSNALKEKYSLGKNYAKWVIGHKEDIKKDTGQIVPLAYRPFDNRFTYFDNKLVWRPRTKTMKHFILGNNVGLVTARSNKNPLPDHFFISKYITEAKLGESSTQSAVFPLYSYYDDGTKTSNLKRTIIQEIEHVVGKTTPDNILDYVYAVLYTPHYREKYKELIKKDFPRIPYPNDVKTFKTLVNLGAELRSLHLLESSKLNRHITTFPVAGDSIVERIAYKGCKVFINSNQYFGGIPEDVWNFYIGGYQPAQKWLKDRKTRILNNEDIVHYQKMVVALSETIRIMNELDKLKY